MSEHCETEIRHRDARTGHGGKCKHHNLEGIALLCHNMCNIVHLYCSYYVKKAPEGPFTQEYLGERVSNSLNSCSVFGPGLESLMVQDIRVYYVLRLRLKVRVSIFYYI